MMRIRQSGFAYIAAVVLLIVVALVCVALLRLSGTQQNTVNSALLGARAGLAARGGIEWGFFQLRNGACNGETTLNDFVADSGFRVTVTCTSNSFNEGEDSAGNRLEKRMVQLEAVACNGGGPCPDRTAANVTRPDYVERRRVATTCVMGTAGLC
ncbi:MSHA biogenesis protein MshP [Massilia sp. IC2-477]|uniref:MSHA biogenesis protein MshP n=1 Tax=unclassified Massilia TaxID=2609279 RepID=UPI001D0FFAB3|nr:MULTISPECIES: MSHA biogenesis protein MshP [unclassified Massilia]MCC2954698.1 MSHA biogenesis protein MshP [Massilia sp. IC2-477]MCC2972687.1 MSHA biogenesis protein MshP [Massilia sp. IC2-476]